MEMVILFAFCRLHAAVARKAPLLISLLPGKSEDRGAANAPLGLPTAALT
jgi:hypothetical protein